MEAGALLIRATGAVMLASLFAGFSALLYTLVYRLAFHPLAKYPGPFIAKFTNLYAAWHSWKGDIHLDMWECHLKYGDRVRYGPNRVLINNAVAVHDIYGRSAPVKKSEGYRVLATQAPNTLTLSDKAKHAHRRRVVSQAFSERSMRMFEPILASKIDRLCRIIRDNLNNSTNWTGPLNMEGQFTYLVFDSLTSVAFSEDYNTMEQARFRFVSKAISETNTRLGALMQAPKLLFGRLDKKIFVQSVSAGQELVKFLRNLLEDRLRKDGSSKDIFSFLRRCGDPETGEGLSTIELSTETATFLVAGSETTSTTMSALAYYLSGSRRCYRKVAREIHKTFESSDEIRLGAKLNSCVFLRACIDEALRLSPPGGATFWREVEAGGGVFGAEFIPEGCEVGVAAYTMHHHPSYWVDPFVYKPERWLAPKDKSKGYVGSRLAYFPFSIGSRSCVGKPLAMSQIMLTFARLFWEFDFQRARNERDDDTQLTLAEYALKDHVTGRGEGPVLHFRARF